MRLRPAIVDNMLLPGTIRLVLQPEDAVIVRHRCDQIRASIPVYVCNVYESEISQGPIGMEVPVRRTRINGSLQPARRSQNVVTPVAIDISDTDSMAIAARADFMLNKAALPAFIPGKRSFQVAKLRQNFVSLP